MRAEQGSSLERGQGRGDGLGHTRHSATDGGHGRRLRTAAKNRGYNRGYGRRLRRRRTAATNGALGGSHGRRLRTAAADRGCGRRFRRRPRTVPSEWLLTIKTGRKTPVEIKKPFHTAVGSGRAACGAPKMEANLQVQRANSKSKRTCSASTNSKVK